MNFYYIMYSVFLNTLMNKKTFNKLVKWQYISEQSDGVNGDELSICIPVFAFGLFLTFPYKHPIPWADCNFCVLPGCSSLRPLLHCLK